MQRDMSRGLFVALSMDGGSFDSAFSLVFWIFKKQVCIIFTDKNDGLKKINRVETVNLNGLSDLKQQFFALVIMLSL